MSEQTISEEAIIEGIRATTALMWYDFNVSKVDQINEIYGEDHHPNYIEEKLDLLIKRGILWVYGQLDCHHRKVFIEAVYNRYRKDAVKYTEGLTERKNNDI